MTHKGTLILTDQHGQEGRVPCEVGLDSYAYSDGGLRIRGVLNVGGTGLEAAREVMERSRRDQEPVAHFTGEVYTADRRARRLVENLPVRIEGIDETGNVRVESDEAISA